jgi:hypothetical protein
VTARPEQGLHHKPRGREPATMDAVLLRRLNRRQAQSVSGQLADLYVDSRKASSREPYRSLDRQDFLNRLAAEIRRPGFAMVIAETDRLMGCAFGYRLRGDGFRWVGFEAALPHDVEQLTESGGVFAITDILVRPHPQGQEQDVARRLRERLLTDHQASRGATLVHRAEHPAPAAAPEGGGPGGP